MSPRAKIAAIINESHPVGDHLYLADEILELIHGDAKPVAWQYQDGWGNWHSTDFPFSPEKVQNDPHIRPLFLAPPPPVVTREQVKLAAWTYSFSIGGSHTDPTARLIAMTHAVRRLGLTVESEGE